MDNNAVLAGVESGRWMRAQKTAKKHQRPDALRPIPLGINTPTTAATKPEKGRYELAVEWWTKGKLYYGFTYRQWVVTSCVLIVALLTLTIVILEGTEIINILPPEFHSPPPPPGPPPLPSRPPFPPTPPKPPSPPPHPPPPPHTPVVSTFATTSCTHIISGIVIPLTNNGRCEDGGVGSVAAICSIGTDYPDCAQRTLYLSPSHPPEPPPPPPSPPPPLPSLPPPIPYRAPRPPQPSPSPPPPSPSPPPPSWTQFAHIGITTQSISSSAYNTSLGSQTSNDAVWWTSCSAAQTLSGKTNPAIMLTMGSVVDYFRPTANHTLCEMLSSADKHDWSNDGVTWVTPAHYYWIMGGSAYEWPKHNVQGDDRDYLSMWGTGTHPVSVSGCCHNALDDAGDWYKTFDMYVNSAPSPPPLPPVPPVPPAPPPPPSPSPPSPPPPPSPTPPSPPGLLVCEDDCRAVTSTGLRVLHQNGACDDGLEGSQSSQCNQGTDCTDCGERMLYPPPPPQGHRYPPSPPSPPPIVSG